MANPKEKFLEYKPSKKALFWSCAGTAVVTMVVGFAWGGWMTGGSAQDMADARAEQAVASLAADLCYQAFLNAPDARTNHAALMDESSYSRDTYLEDGGWLTFAGREDPIEMAAQPCAERLAEMDASELPGSATPATDAAIAETDADVVPAETSDDDGTVVN